MTQQRVCLRSFSLISALFSLFALSPAAAQTTTWTGTTGDWSTASNWSNGEPTASTDVVIPFGTPTITLAGEVCRNLTTGTQNGGSILQISSGSLTVSGTLAVSQAFSSTVQHFGGLVTADVLNLGGGGISAAYVMTQGTLHLGSAQIGGSGTLDAVFSFGPSVTGCTISGSLHINSGGHMVVGGGNFQVGTSATDSVVVSGGAFSVVNKPTITMMSFTMKNNAILAVAVSPGVPKIIMVSGSAVLEGQFIITDVLAPKGTYEVLRANSLQGSFSGVTSPQGWSYKIEGNSLFVVKADVAAEPATWSGLKRRFEP